MRWRGCRACKSVGATNDPDLANDDRNGDVVVSGYTPKPDEEFDVELPWVSNGYLQTLGVPLVAGRYVLRDRTQLRRRKWPL